MKKLHIGFLVSALMTFSTQANELPYSYADATFSTFDNADAISIGGSFDFANGFYAVGEYSKIELERINIDLIDLKIGGGYHYSIAPKTDVFAELAYLNRNLDGGSGSSLDDNGYLLSVGLRKMLLDNVEIRARLEYEDIFVGSETNFELGGLYYFSNQVGLGFGLQTKGNNDLEGFVLRARYAF